MQKPRIIINNFRTWSTRNAGYTDVAAEDEDPRYLHRSESDSVLAKAFFPNAWFITTILLLVVMARQNHDRIGSRQFDTYEVGFKDDFHEARAAIKMEQRRFTYALRDSPNGTLYPSYDPNEPLYVGQPSPKIDAAWEQLLKGRYFGLRESEIDQLNQDAFLPNLTAIATAAKTKSQPAPNREGGGDKSVHGDNLPPSQHDQASDLHESAPATTLTYFGEPDMFHSLHCVNELRKHIDMDYYRGMMRLPEDVRRMHIEHCVEQLRQAIMCHGDLTPVTLKPVMTTGNVKYFLGETERMHTCRDANAIREWMLERGRETGVLGYS